jgi:hypothetical protein
MRIVMVSTTVRVMPRRVAVVTALVMITLAWVVGATTLTRASAAEIDGAITGVNIVENSAGPYQAMQLDLTWAVPDSATQGDTFTLELPPELRSVTAGFNLLAPDGSVVAVAKVVGTLVTFTLTDYADTHNGVHGGAEFAVRWNLANTPASGPVSLDFTTSTRVFHDTVIKNPGSGTVDRTEPRKVGHWVDSGITTGADALGWTIDSPNGPFDKATFDDKVAAGQAIDCSTVLYQLGKGLDATGHASTFQALPTSKVISSSCAAGELKLVAGPILADQIIRIKYLVTITDPTLASYTNSVDVTVDSTQFSTVVRSIKVQRATGSGTGTPTSPTTSPTSVTTSPTTSPTSVTTSPTTSPTSVTTSPTTSPSTGPTVLPTKLTASPTSTVGGLAFTGANVGPMLVVALLLLGGGLVFAMAGRKPREDRKH